MPLLRFQVRNEYGLGDPELYGGAVKREDPKAVLDGVAVAGLVGILRQLGDLAEFAADIFHDLHEQVIATSARGRKVMTRVRNIEAALPSLEKAIRGQTSHIHLAYIAGCEWHARVRTEKGHLLLSDLPRFMMDSYEECRDPPRLYLLDKFDNGGPGACLKRYSDPTFFEKAWDMLSKVKDAENAHKGKKHHRIKRRGSRTRNGGIQNAPGGSRLRNGALPEMLIASQHDSQRFESPSSDTHSLSENRSVHDIPSNPDMISRSTSLGSKSHFNLVEQVTDPDPVSAPLILLPNEIKYTSPSSVIKQEDTIPVNNNNNNASLSPPRSITWDEKAPIHATSSNVYCDDVMMDQIHVINPMFDNNQEEDILPGSGKFPLPLTLEVVSEGENYVDALNTLESETETEMEYYTNTKVNKFHDSGYESVEKPIDETLQLLQIASSDDLLASSERIETEHEHENSSMQHESQRNSDFAASEVYEMNALSPTDDKQSVNGNVSKRESQNLEISEISPEISTLDINEYSRIAPTDFSEHSVPLKTESLDETDDPSIENSSRVKIKSRNASRRYEFLQYSDIPDLTVQSNDENGTNDDYFHRNVVEEPLLEEARVSSTVTTSESVENEEMMMQGSNHDIQTMPPNGTHDNIIINENFNIEQSSYVNNSSAKLWTNAGLFGLEPSKPPVFTSANNNPTDETVPHIVANGSMPDSNISEDVNETLPGNFTMNGDDTSHENKGNNNNGMVNLSSSFSSLAQRFLTNTLQKRISSSSSPSSQIIASEPHINENIISDAKILLSPSVSPLSCNSTSRSSSPPLEFMKLSFRPMNGTLDDEGTDHDAVFPDFQILSGTAHPAGDSGSDSDEDTFGRSYAYSSEDLSPRLFSNSDVWDPDEIIDDNNNASASNYMEFERTELHGIETVSNLNRDLNLNSNLNLNLNSNQMPPPPPLPPVQWRLNKPAGSSSVGDDTNPNLVLPWQNHVHLPSPPIVPAMPFQPKLSRNEEKPEIRMDPSPISVREMKIEGELIHWNKKKFDHQKFSGHEKSKIDASRIKDQDEREELLDQIRNKSFNLRRTVRSKPDNDSTETPTNSSVSAIIEKANAIRQAFVGSDDGRDDDSWSDM